MNWFQTFDLNSQQMMLCALAGFFVFIGAHWYREYLQGAKALWITASLFVVVAFTMAGCASYGPQSSWDGGVARFPTSHYSCAPDALAKYLELTQGLEMTNEEAVELYEQARRVDGLDDSEEGTSLYGVMKACTNVSHSVPLYSSEQTIDALTASPVLLRLPVYHNTVWWNTQFWNSEGEFVGEHAIVCIGYKGGIFTLMNNQGPYWGSGGKIWLWEADLEEWLKDGKASAWVLF